ncbi:MAG: hypothetical protein R8G66_23910 [Cytophagales bacterium]|nr:hypothetical protein [Cytophagales bacterium]
MKSLRIIFILIVTLLLVIFSVQNAEPTCIAFLGFEAELSKSILMLLCVAVGSIFTMLAFLPGLIRKKKKQPETTSEPPTAND